MDEILSRYRKIKNLLFLPYFEIFRKMYKNLNKYVNRLIFIVKRKVLDNSEVPIFSSQDSEIRD